MSDKKDELMKKLKFYEDEIKKIKYEQQKLNEQLDDYLKKKQKIQDQLSLAQSEELATKDWSNIDYKWSKEVENILENKFKIKKFRHQQLNAINATLSNVDLILLMPTGGGKSLCYQLPALVNNGTTIVISPLISLMEDQIMSLKKLNINAEMLSSSTDKELTKSIYNSLINKSNLKLLYVTPERLAKSKRFMSCLQKLYERKGLDRFAIDEVHCCSQWGHDFRPDYKYLTVLKSLFSDVPIIGLTATATSQILVDVQSMLDISGCLILKASFNRPNLFYKVQEKPSNQSECVNIIENLIKNEYNNQSGIIYTNTIKDSIDLAKDLKSRGCSIGCYHAEMEPQVRSKVHNKWYSGECQVVVATIAFGMGIDKPDVKFVIHHSIPKSLENYYQESGRAGRNGKKADCIMFYRLADVFRLSQMVFSTKTGLPNLYSLVDYCLNDFTCRRALISEHFDDTWDSNTCNKMCDNCLNGYGSKPFDITQYCKDIFELLKHAAGLEQQLTTIKLIDAWFQKGGAVNLRVKSMTIPKFSKTFGENILAKLLILGYLKEDFHFTAYSTISYIKRGPKADLLNDNTHKIIIQVKDKSNRKASLTTNSKRSAVDFEKDEISKPKKSKVFIIDSDSD